MPCLFAVLRDQSSELDDMVVSRKAIVLSQSSKSNPSAVRAMKASQYT